MRRGPMRRGRPVARRGRPVNKRRGRVNRQTRARQQGEHTHQVQAHGYGHSHQNGQTIYHNDPLQIYGISGMGPTGNPVPLFHPTQTAGSHQHPSGLPRPRRRGQGHNHPARRRPNKLRG